jgi:pseudaminic acid biosynthesis-associated methylase
MNSPVTKGEGIRDTETAETTQGKIWQGDFGRDYTDRNLRDAQALDELYRKNYGLSRTEINRSLLRGIPPNASFLEVGCNTGSQLELLQQMGWKNLSGIELQPYALAIAQKRLPGVSLKLGSARQLPFSDRSFDVVFTSGVLIHIAPDGLPHAMDEIYRCSRKYIWGFEYYAPETTELSYHGHNLLLWKMDFAKRYLERFSDLHLVEERRLPYISNDNIDTVFLLQKTES